VAPSAASPAREEHGLQGGLRKLVIRSAMASKYGEDKKKSPQVAIDHIVSVTLLFEPMHETQCLGLAARGIDHPPGTVN
jgi:hypothetical protein